MDGIFLGKREYEVDILKRFGMLDCKEIATPMEYNLNLMSDALSESVDATMYCQMISSLMYLTNTRPDICFCGENPEPVPNRSKTCLPDSCKACIEVPKRYSGLWAQV